MKVSVLVVTYNHEKYIAQAIQSILVQETDFEFEIVVGEDYSTDSTRQIVAGLQDKHPGTIRLLPATDKLGMQRNYMRTWKECRGEYVAMLDGDDYWTSPLKLQRQVDFMEAHPECSMCFHRAQLISEDAVVETITRPSSRLKSMLCLRDMLIKNPIPNCSVMYRRALMEDLPAGYEGLYTLDWPIHVFFATRGKVGYIREIMSVWRLHGGSSFSSKPQIERLKRMLDCRRWVCDNFVPGQYRWLLRSVMSNRYYKLMLEYEKAGDRVNAMHYAEQAFREFPLNVHLAAHFPMKWLDKHIPSVLAGVRNARRYIAGAIRLGTKN